MSYRRVTYPAGWTLTRHAQVRMDEMGITAARLFAVLADPSLSYPGAPASDGRPTTVFVRGSIGAIVSAEERTVVTIIWHLARGRTGCGLASV